jgi:putative intracellular protease/amidase
MGQQRAMNRRHVMKVALGAGSLLAAGGAAWVATLPPAPGAPNPPPIPESESAAVLAALRPPKRPRPLIAIIGLNEGTEVTDYLMPYGILSRAGIADVAALGMTAGPVSLYPALKVAPQQTAQQFDAQHPDGADYVIVPAMMRDDDPAVLRWIKTQSDKGAIVIGVCVGALVVANTGLLDGKRATTHWYSVKALRERHPALHYVPDRRIVMDRGVATTTGISASMPMALTLIEAIAGRDKADSVARGLGLFDWDARHDSKAFRFNRPFALTAIQNRLSFWGHERLGMALAPGVDEVSLALVADAWSRTYRSRAITFAGSAGAVPTRNGIGIFPDTVADGWPAQTLLPAVTDAPPALALDQTLRAIETRYGARTASFVAMQLEYPRRR